jgi:dihydrofolate reductase
LRTSGCPSTEWRKQNVVSTTLREPLEWQNSTLLVGDLADAVATLKQENGGDLLVIGSAELARKLVNEDRVDEFRLMIDRLLMGGGKRLFPEDGALRPFRLVHSESTTTGAILATYAAQAET